MLKSKHAATFALLAVLAYLYFRGIGDHGLLDPLEGINASVSLEMAARKSLFVPMMEGLPYLGKTMGFWWLEAGALAVFGWTEFAVRFWPALAALAMVTVSWLLARHLRDARAGNIAAVVSGTALLTYAASQLVVPHTLYAFCVSLALLAFVRALRDARFFVLFHLAAVLAFVAAGPAGMLLPWLCLLLYTAALDEEELFRAALLDRRGLLVTLLLGGGYLMLLQMKNPAFLSLIRYTPPALAFGSWDSALFSLLFGLFPWVGFLPETVKDVFPNGWKVIPPSQRREFLLLVWSGVFAFFGALSGDALLLTATVPPLAVLCALRLARAVDEKDCAFLRRGVAFSSLFFAAFFAAGMPWLFFGRGELFRTTLFSTSPWFFFCFLYLAVGRYYSRTRQPRKLVLHLCGVSLLGLLPLAGVFDLLGKDLSLREMGRYIRDEADGNDLLVQYALNRPSLFFYTARRSRLSETFPIPGLYRQKAFAGEELPSLWTGPERVFLLLEKKQELFAPLPQDVFNLYEAHGLTLLSNRRSPFPRRPDLGKLEKTEEE